MIIQLEGGEASGKSTLLNLFSKYLKHKPSIKTVTSIHYPNPTRDFGDLAYSIIRQKHTYQNPSFPITLLCICDQYTTYVSSPHIYKEVNDKVLLSSRGYISTLVYAELYKDKLEDSVTSILEELIKRYIPLPDVVIYLDTSVDIIEKRLKMRLKTTKDKSENIYDKVELIKVINERYNLILNNQISKGLNVIKTSSFGEVTDLELSEKLYQTIFK
jgi:thymidylate kinase